jgi:hypothetical protein
MGSFRVDGQRSFVEGSYTLNAEASARENVRRDVTRACARLPRGFLWTFVGGQGSFVDIYIFKGTNWVQEFAWL